MIPLIEFIMFLALDGRQIEVNPEQVVTVAEVREEDRIVSDKVHCIITLTDGKIISVAESCASVKGRLERMK